jgi:sodium-dependent dicarboxylate transporter 2/3/5
MLYAALVLLGSSIYNKGMADWVADLVERLIADPALMKLILPIILIILMPLISAFIGAVGAVSIFGPLFMKISCRYGMECPVIGILLTMASSFAYLRFSASPASAIVFATGYLRKGDFLKLGWKMVIYSAILLIIIAVFYWGY